MNYAPEDVRKTYLRVMQNLLYLAQFLSLFSFLLSFLRVSAYSRRKRMYILRSRFDKDMRFYSALYSMSANENLNFFIKDCAKNQHYDVFFRLYPFEFRKILKI